ncbi:M23 family metallopeptidase [Sphingomonas morindae]|uniref:M23 family metallopeptidase n=1 Tax=Sphingomonas morindae TaxID=1541170 RepID=A0ABY4X4I2_9SPHN|nr:M23 family metallopeptidase [Sphingomonas morindae]USI71747.1 M23 family metallopeptidase [Sphingomonas morindae]
MNRFGIAIAGLLLLLLIGFAAVVRVTGPGWSGTSPHVVAPPPAAPGSPAPGGAPATLPVPVQGVARAQLSSSWSDPRDGGTRAHHAIDIPAPRGTPVLAVADGTIEKLYTSALGGLTVYERTPDGGLVYYYAHLDRYAPQLAEGQMVRAGQVLGAVGSTGDADARVPHLHFEIHRMAPGEAWWQGEELDPYPILRRG